MTWTGRRLSDQVVDHLQSLILSGAYSTDERLPTEIQLASELNVSRTVVRDALRTLAARGLVRVRPRLGVVVVAPNEDNLAGSMLLMLARSDLSIRDLVSARAVVETEMVPMAANRAQAEDLDRLARHLADFQDSIKARQWSDTARHHLEFHLALVTAMRMPALELLLRPMQHVILLSSLPPDPDDPELWDVDAHVAILTALRTRDRLSIRETLNRHYQLMEGQEYAEQNATLIRDVPTVMNVLQRLDHVR